MSSGPSEHLVISKKKNVWILLNEKRAVPITLLNKRDEKWEYSNTKTVHGVRDPISSNPEKHEYTKLCQTKLKFTLFGYDSVTVAEFYRKGAGTQNKKGTCCISY